MSFYSASAAAHNQLLQHLQQQTEHQDLLIVVIDGYAGAGKSTLADWLYKRLFGSQIIALDDFYRPLTSLQQQLLHEEDALQAYLPTQPFVDQVLRPLRQEQIAKWQALDWLTQDCSPVKQVSPSGVVLVDGVFSSHQHFMPWVDISIMVTTPPVTCRRRVVARNQPDTVWLDHWQETEAWFHTQHHTQAQVDWVIAGNMPKNR